MTLPTAHFEALFAASDDPWSFRTRWYEARKRALTLASLPALHYRRAFEPGCANGELSAELATRCTELLAMDGSARAVHLARVRLKQLAHVELRQGWMPQAWPDGSFDLIVISELGYFLSVPALREMAACALASLAPGGTVLACHWRRPIAGCAMDGDMVHRELHAALALPLLGTTLDADMRLDVWCRDPRSVGEREGLE